MRQEAAHDFFRVGLSRGDGTHFFEQFAGPMMHSWKSLGSPELTPEGQRILIDGVRDEVGTRSIEKLEAERDALLLGLLELRARAEQSADDVEVAAAA